MSLPKEVLENKCLSDWCILHGYRGSISHGTYRPPAEPTSIDDKDTMSVCVPPKSYYIGTELTFSTNGTKEIKFNEWDIVSYEVLKFIKLLRMGNPNVMSLLWLEPTMYIKITPEGQLLIDNKLLFMGKHIYKSYVGYAHGQLHRMTHQKFEGYMGEKRKRLVDQFGFDTKNAAHLIRLLRMGIEALTEGVINVQRQDAQQLIEIKRGEWTLAQVKEEAKRLFDMCDAAYIHSKLPTSLDEAKINNLAVEIIERRSLA